MEKHDFLQMVDAAIEYFDPVQSSENARKLLELANETHKIETDRLQRSINETLEKIRKIEQENQKLTSNLAFTMHEISKLTEENHEKIEKSRYLQELVESRKLVLQETYEELTTYRRNESNIGIAKKRMGKNSNSASSLIGRPKTAIGKSKEIRGKVEEVEENLEKAVAKIKKLNEEVKKKSDFIDSMKFRLGIETNEQKRLNTQYAKLDEAVKIQSKRPSTGVIRNKTVIR